MNITNCYRSGSIGCNILTGGLVGTIEYGNISNSFASGGIACLTQLGGGLVGYSHASNISNCYALITLFYIYSGTYEGGLVGYLVDGAINNCYAVSNFTITGGVNPATNKIGGLVGSNVSGIVTNSFWDNSKLTYSDGGTGKTTAQMTTSSTFLNAGWSPSIWYRDSYNNGYPYLGWQNPSGTPLPVELTSFTAVLNENKVELNWKTATELNNYGFEILRSAQNDGHSESASAGEESWTKIGFVKGAGNSNSPKSYSFVDSNPISGKADYRLKQIDDNGQYKYSNVINISVDNAPTEFSLEQNYPNPFNPSTTINFALPVKSNVTLSVYNSLGQKVTELVNGALPAGNHSVNFNASSLSSGVYIYRLEAVPLAGSKSSSAAFSQTKKMALLK